MLVETDEQTKLGLTFLILWFIKSYWIARQVNQTWIEVDCFTVYKAALDHLVREANLD
jgi:hypothetical protein